MRETLNSPLTYVGLIQQNLIPSSQMLFPVQSGCVPAHTDVETLHLRKQRPPIDIQFHLS